MALDQTGNRRRIIAVGGAKGGVGKSLLAANLGVHLARQGLGPVVVDFFLLADTGFVVTSCEPASYLDADTFMKMALYRRLARIFGPESAFAKFKDEALLTVIRDFVSPQDDQSSQRISDLLNRIEAQAPQRKYLVQEAIDHFRPRRVVAMAEDKDETESLVQRMRKVSRRMLAVDVQYAGCILADHGVAISAREIKPEIARHPKGIFAREIARLLT